jgi:beta-glucosidase
MSEHNKLNKNRFGEHFFWGVSSSALQTEGAYDADGKGLSIWDEFALRKNKIIENHTPFEASNFYTNYKEDIALIKELSIPNFRFSISWPRILPHGTGKVNEKGLAYYDNLINTCIAKGIEPWITLYHWDLPLELEKQGGWANRKILHWFQEYVETCVNAFKHKVKYWIVLNEPMVFTGAGYFMGVHAPGKRGISLFLKAMHHATLCQSIGFHTIKKNQPEAIVGTTFSCSYITPYSNSKSDIQAAHRVDALLNRTFIEPLLGLGYPIDDLPFLKKINDIKHRGDDALMYADFDFIGLQNYTREVVASRFYIPYMRAKLIPADKRKVHHTLMDWEVYPEAIYEMIKKFSQYKSIKKIIITENGASFPDEVIDGVIHDADRQRFISSYLQQVLRAKEEGYKADGYFVWSLTDNFEWAEGYRQRFGLIYVDYPTQQRIIKQSGYWYKTFLEQK